MHIILSIYIPQTSPIGFLDILRSIYGEHLILDNGTKPLFPGYPLRLAERWVTGWYKKIPHHVYCIHGRFFPFSYYPLKREKLLITWFRNPVERVASHYYSWKLTPPTPHPVHQALLQDKLSLLDFARLRSMRNLQSRFISSKLFPHLFFAGIAEQYSTSLQRYYERFGIYGPIKPNRPFIESFPAHPELSAKLVRQITALNAQDMRLYEKAMLEFGD